MSGNYSDFESIPLRIEKETTFILEPVRPDGTINYTAAVNRSASAGVTPENNAAVPLAQLFGPELFREVVLENSYEHLDLMTQSYFEKLGIPIPEESAEYFQSLQDFAKADAVNSNLPTDALSLNDYINKFYDQLNQANVGLWGEDQLPELAAWVRHNGQFDPLIFEAVQREKFYSPLVIPDSSGSTEGMLFWAVHPVHQNSRDLADYLSAKATLTANQQNIDQAIEYALCAHRLARQLSHSYGLIDSMVAISVDVCAFDASLALIQSGKLTVEQLQYFRKQIHELAPLPVIADKVNYFERLSLLDVFSRASVSDPQGVEVLSNIKPSQQQGDTFVEFLRILDWNLILSKTNERYDLLNTSMLLPTFAERAQAQIELEKLYEKNSEQFTPWNMIGAALRLKINDRQSISNVLGVLYIELIVPGFMKARDAEDRGHTREKLLEIAFALEIHRQQQGAFPETLDEMEPPLDAALVQDIFTEQPLKYQKTETGYRLYSFGMNRTDDDGRIGGYPLADDLMIEQSSETLTP